MATIARVKLTPLDHGRPIAYEDFLACDGQEGFQYELIDGKVYVAALPNPPHARLDKWIYDKLNRYSSERPDVVNYVYYHTVVFVPGRAAVTCPQPDVSAYHDFPLHLPSTQVRWQDVSPILTVEVLSPDTPEKDLVRNVELYWQVPSIREYWIIDGLEDPDRPALQVRRRHGKRWRIIDMAFGETYTTKMLPDFELLVNPRG